MNPLPSVRAPVLSKEVLALLCGGMVAIAAAAIVWVRPTSHELAAGLACVAVTMTVSLGLFELLSGLLGLTAGQSEESSRGLLSDYCDNLQDGLLLCHADGQIVFSNAAFWRQLAITNDGSQTFAADREFGRLPAGADAVFRLVKAQANGADWEEVIELSSSPTGKSESRWLRISLKCGTAGAARYCAWKVSDVTLEQTRQGETLQKLKRNLDQLDILPAGVFAAAAHGRITYMNATLANWLGIDRSSSEVANLTIDQLLPAQTRPAIAAGLARTATDGTISLDTVLRGGNGDSMPVRLLGRTLGAKPHLALGMLMTQPQSELRPVDMQTGEARFTRLFHTAPIAIATVDAQGRIGSANPAFTTMFFDSTIRQTIVGMELFDRLHPDCRPAVRAALEKAAKGERPLNIIEVVVGDDKRSAVQLFLSSIPDSGPERDNVILYALDTTERKELEAQFAQSQKMQAIGQLAGGIAHDINNVLTVIIGFSDLLLANSAGDPSFHDLNEIKSNANRAANLVRQLLAFSRRQTLRPEILSLNEVISDLSVFLKRSLGEKVKLERDYGRDLWLVKADQTELGRVFVNLAVNAVDAMPAGGTLTIRTCNMARDSVERLGLSGLAPADYVMCQVADTGQGMTREVLEKIFEPFFTTKDVGKGTGLGLSTVYGIVKQTGGYIYCDSGPGAGTSFRIFLPRHTAGSPRNDIQTKVERKEKPRDLTGSGTVLLVEDEESVRRFAARALRRQGYVVLEAGHGVEALEIKSSYRGAIDVVVSDIVMPEMDGPTLLKELRKDSPQLKIIFMSGYADDALSSLDNNEDFAFLAKPFQLSDLVSAVKELIPT